ncbi:MAG: cyclic nucleotide-binding domain-containing protein [Candidatus Tectomicrobia bacterium]|uniref:Cyclic nucleotide-binding domain-containing protein n=1 Tax=Tectimicrobiota bacterium TaxID=2528274 RepID=A0A932I2D4_UNCTE|nr:cyclic nucleotide-binding domain-containing protein [Candidatus Tectomicrobia bacterium]
MQAPKPAQPEPRPPNPALDAAPIMREGGPNMEGLLAKLRGSYSFFSGMSPQELVWFLRLCSRRSYEPGDVIFQEGEMGDCFYLIIFGEVAISRGGAPIATLDDGNCFGEMAVLESTPRNATATAAKKTLVFCVEREILTNVFPSLGFKVAASLARDLSQKLREADDRLKGKREG